MSDHADHDPAAVDEHPLVARAREAMFRRPSLEMASILGALCVLQKQGVDAAASISRETLSALALVGMKTALEKTLDDFLGEDRWWTFVDGAADPRTEPHGFEEPLA